MSDNPVQCRTIACSESKVMIENMGSSHRQIQEESNQIQNKDICVSFLNGRFRRKRAVSLERVIWRTALGRGQCH